MWQRIKGYWQEFTPEERRFSGQYCAVIAITLLALLLHGYGHYDGWWTISSASSLFWWITTLPASPGGYFCRKYGPAAFWAVVVYGLIFCWAFANLGSALGVVVTILDAAAFLWGLGYWPKAPPKPAPVPTPATPPVTTFGSARWGTLEYMLEHRLIGGDGLLLGIIPKDDGFYRLRYAGDRHLATIAPTRSGKGTNAIIPNLLATASRSVLVIDPKGENAMITAAARRRMGQEVHIVDPWGIAASAGKAARFNPLDWLQVGDIDIAENAMLLADALVMDDGKGETFWNEEAKALLQGLILYVATEEEEQDNRHLGRVRDLLMLDGEDTPKLFKRMTQSLHHVVMSTGARSLQKDEKLLSNVLASAQSHTRFLDSPRMRASLAVSDFKFEDLKRRLTTIYLVLPADRLEAFGRWLRLLIQQAITVNARDIETRPDEPVLFILDELAALGRLSMIEQAYGLMAGFGMQLWAIFQSTSDALRVYGKTWETFVANSGAIMYYGSRDNAGAEYFSKLCGMATVLNFSETRSFSTSSSFSSTYAASGNSYTSGTSYTSGVSYNYSHVQRKLAFPDELMRLEDNMQLVLIDHHRPILAERMPWFRDPDFRLQGRNLHLEGLTHGRGHSTPLQLERRSAPETVPAHG